MKHHFNKIANMPVGVLATSVGVATLSNAWEEFLGFEWLRHVMIFFTMVIWVLSILKMTIFFKDFKEDYCDVVPCSLYPTFAMLTMILGSYFADVFHFYTGRTMWFAGLLLHVIHIIIFTYRNVIKGIKLETFLPCWFVTYVAVLVSVVTGYNMQVPDLLRYIVIYGFIMYAILFTALVVRVLFKPVKSEFKLTMAIFFAPTSILIVSYLNAFGPNVIPLIIYILYSILLITVLVVATKIPAFLRLPFDPSHASLTFPFAIAQVATFRVSDFFTMNGNEQLGDILWELAGIQLFATTSIIMFVTYNFLRMYKRSYRIKRN